MTPKAGPGTSLGGQHPLIHTMVHSLSLHRHKVFGGEMTFSNLKSAAQKITACPVPGSIEVTHTHATRTPDVPGLTLLTPSGTESETQNPYRETCQG